MAGAAFRSDSTPSSSTAHMKVIAALAALLFVAGILTAALAGLLIMSEDTGPVAFESVTVAPLPVLEPAAMQRGEKLYVEHCATCHGVKLQGAPDWRFRLPDGTYPPPPHDVSGHTWQHSDAALIRMIANGINQTLQGGMPAFREKLSAAEMTDVLTFLKSRWGRDERRRQWWQTQTGSDVPPK